MTKNIANKKRLANIVYISLSGMIVMVIIAYSFYTSMNINRKYFPYLNTIFSIKHEITTSYIWLEELLIGDLNNSMDGVIKHVEKADWYIEILLEGGENTERTFLPVQDQEVRNKIDIVKEKLVSYRNIAEKRYKDPQTSVSGSEIDQYFDTIFSEIIIVIDEIETRVLRIIKEETNKFQIMEWVLIVGIATMTSITCLVFYKQDLRKENEKVIRLESEKAIKHLASFPQKNINPILEVDSSGIIIFYNIAATKLLKNLNLDEKLSVFLPDDFNEIQKRLEQKKEVQLYREVQIKELVFGEYLHVIPEFNVIRIYTRDITEDKRVEAVLKNEREKFYSILDSIPAYIYLQNKESFVF